MSSSTEKNVIIDVMHGMGTSSPQISRFTQNFDEIHFLTDKNLDGYTIVMIVQRGADTSVIYPDGNALTIASDSESGKTTLIWKPGAEVTASSGIVVYQIAAYLQHGDEISSVWYSKEGRIAVSESIDTADFSTATIGSHPNIITSLILELDKTKTTISNLEKNKQDSAEGMGLSTNDFDNPSKEKLDSVAYGANTNVQADWAEESQNSDAYIKNRPIRFCTIEKKDGMYDEFTEPGIYVVGFKELPDESAYLFVYNTENLGYRYVQTLFDTDASICSRHYMYGEWTDWEVAATKSATDQISDHITKILNGETIVEKARYDSEGNNISRYYASNDDLNGLVNYVEHNIDFLSKDIAAINKAPATSQPGGDVFETNTAYHLGEQPELRVEFPSYANDGDVIYLNFYSGDMPTNFWMITTNTSDIELIPEANIGYEIYARYVEPIVVGHNGKWIVNYSEYTIGG